MALDVDIEIKRLSPDDLAVVKDLIYRTIDHTYPSVYSPAAVQFFKSHHSSQSILRDVVQGHAIVLYHLKDIIGTGTLVGSTIKRVFVDPEYQGQGLGRKIMTYLEEQARLKGKTVVRLDAALLAKSFYEKLGYTIVRDTFVPLENNERCDYSEMKKELHKQEPAAQQFHKKLFRIVDSANSFVAQDALFHFEQSGNILWASYKGSSVSFGQLLAVLDDENKLNIRFQQYTRKNELQSGTATGNVEQSSDGKRRLFISWSLQTMDQGSCVLEEMELNHQSTTN